MLHRTGATVAACLLSLAAAAALPSAGYAAPTPTSTKLRDAVGDVERLDGRAGEPRTRLQRAIDITKATAAKDGRSVRLTMRVKDLYRETAVPQNVYFTFGVFTDPAESQAPTFLISRSHADKSLSVHHFSSGTDRECAGSWRENHRTDTISATLRTACLDRPRSLRFTAFNATTGNRRTAFSDETRMSKEVRVG